MVNAIINNYRLGLRKIMCSDAIKVPVANWEALIDLELGSGLFLTLPLNSIRRL